MTQGSNESPRELDLRDRPAAGVDPTAAQGLLETQLSDAERLIAAYHYDLPERLIAQQPAQARDDARLLPIAREDGRIVEAPDARVSGLARWLRPGDLLVLNATRVIPARLRGHKASGGRCEALLLDAAPLAPAAHADDGRSRYRALVKSSGRLRVGLVLVFDAVADAPAEPASMPATRAGDTAAGARAEIVALDAHGIATLAFSPGTDPLAFGEAPLPPYIRRPGEAMTADQRRADLERYQTVFAREPGAIAAPTAGLHLTQSLLDELAAGGVERAELVLHVGLGTFRPLRPEDVRAGRLHRERYELGPDVAEAIARTRARGGRVVAVGTTTTRVLEHCADGRGGVLAGRGETDLFLRPGSKLQVVDGLLTNFHLPGSSLLMLVAAFIGHAPLMAAYRHAVDAEFRFFSYGDAMLVMPGPGGASPSAPSGAPDARGLA